MTGRSPTLNRESPSPYVEINPKDAEKLGVRDKSSTRISSRRGEIVATAEVSDAVPPGTLFMPWHFEEAPANKLTIASLDPVSKIPSLKVCSVKVERA